MAKKQFLDETLMEEELSGDTAAKMPLNITGGRRSLADYLEIPVDQLVPFGGKDGRDFKRTDKVLLEQMKQSVKDDGIVEALTVRAMGRDRYEILAGETRWLMAQEAGLRSVPCHIIAADDIEATRVFTITNLLRRTLLPSDRVNGWTLFHEAEKKAGRLSELRRAVDEYASINPTGEETPTYRTIMYYVQMSRLIPEWLDRLDERKVAQKAARLISRLPEDKQRQLLPYNVTEDDARLLVEIAKGKHDQFSWSEEFLSQTLAPLHSLSGEAETTEVPEAPGTPETPEAPDNAGGSAEAARDPGAGTDPTQRTPAGRKPAQTGDLKQTANPEQYQQEKLFRKAKPSIIKAAKGALRPSDYGNAETIIMQALALYYKMLDSAAEQESP